MRRSPLALLLALLATVALLAGCGASGGNDEGADSPTTEAPADGGTTEDEGSDDAGSEDEGTEDEGGSGGGASNLTDADLAALLPTESDIGNGYLLIDDDDDESDDSEFGDESDDTDEALEEACPALAQLGLDDDTDDGPSVTFQVPADEREIEVSLTRDAEVFAEDRIDELIDAFNECGTIDVTDDASGMGISMELSAERTDDFGDFGMRLHMDAQFSFFGMPIAIEFRGIAFGRDGINVFVSASSGMDEGDGFDLTPVPPDEDVLEAMAQLMDERIAAL